MALRTEFTRRLAVAGLLLTLLASASACGSRGRAKTSRQPAPGGMPPMTGEAETGLASWYGDPYHGRPTASGETYNMNAFTAAHRTLPFSTWVRVTSLENHLFTTVKINDRGPFIEGRIIDLSRAAAEAIGMVGAGTMLVRVEVVKHPEQVAITNGVYEGFYGVQVGSFRSEENALRLQAALMEEYGDVVVQTYEAPDGIYYRVRVGRFSSYYEAEELAFLLRDHPEVAAALVVRLD